MNGWTPSDRRIGLGAAVSQAAIGVVYVITGSIGVVARPPGSNPLRQVDPYLAILELLIILSAVALVFLMCAVYAYAPPNKKTQSLAALAFIIAFAVLTCATHFASLTVGRQINSKALLELSRQLSFEEWPTLALALDLLAWDFFLGLSLLLAAPVFSGSRLQNALRRVMYIDGALCLAGTLGPLLGRMWLEYSAIIGYGFVLTVVCILLALVFARTAKA